MATLSEKQEQVLTSMGIRYPELVERLKPQRNWLWLYDVAGISELDQSHIVSLGFKWSRKRNAYYHTCGVESKGKRKAKKKEKSETKRLMDGYKDAEKASMIILAAVARGKAGKGGA